MPPAACFLFALLKESKQRKGFFGVCWVFCVALRWEAGSRPGGRLTFFASPKKVSKKRRATSVPLTRSLALLAAFGTLANSLRSNSASVLIRTLLRCSARPNGGGIPLGSSASRTSPEWLVRFAHFAGLGFLISHASLLSRARHAVPLRLIPSFLTAHHGQPQGLPLRPHSYALNPHSSPLRPHSSLLNPQKIHQRLQQGLRRFCHLVVAAG